MDKKIIKNIFSMFSIQGVNYLIPLIMVPYLVRVLGFDGFGVYTIILSIIQYFVIINDYGFSLSASRQIALNVEDKDKVSAIFFSVISCKIIISLLSFILFLVFVFFNPKYNDYFYFFLYGFGIVIGNSFYPVWLFQGYEKMYWIAISNLSAKLFGLLLIFLYVRNSSDMVIAIIIQSITGILASVIAFTKAKVSGLIIIKKPSFKEMLLQMRLGWSIFLSTFFVSLYTTSIALILGYNSGAESVGIYNAADKLKQALQGVIGPVSQAIYPRSNRLMVESEKKAIRFVFTISIYFVSFLFLASVIIFSFADLIVSLFFGNGHESSVEILRIIIWIPPIVAIANMIGIQLLLPLGMNRYFGLIYVLTGCIGFPLMFLGSYYWSYTGVAYVALIIELMIAILFLFIFMQKKRDNDDLHIHMYTN